MSPLASCLKFVQSDTSSLSSVVEIFRFLIANVQLNDEERVLFSDRRSMLLKPVHYAAYFLDPIHKGADLTEDEFEVMMEWILKVSNQLNLDQTELLHEVALYRYVINRCIWLSKFTL